MTLNLAYQVSKFKFSDTFGIFHIYNALPVSVLSEHVA